MSEVSEPLVHSLLRIARRCPGHAAFLTPAGRVSYGDFAAMVFAAARRLGECGLASGDRVVICAPNSPAWAAAYFAVHAIGCVAVPLDADVRPAGARQLVEDSQAKCAVASQGVALALPCHDLSALCDPQGASSDFTPDCRLDDVADLLFTTGTTGRKKGVALTHRQIAQAAANINAFVQTGPEDRELVPLPLSHSFGLGRLRSMARTGNTLLLEAGMRNPAKVLKQVLDHKLTGVAMVPAGFDLLLRLTRDRLADAASHLRYIEIGSAAMPLETKRRLMELLPRTRICHHYGLTEASRAAFLEYHADRAKLGSIGRPSPNVRIEVRDDQGRRLPPGECGELVVQGGMVMKEYWRQPELTSQTLRDGWLRTADWGYQDDEGYLYLAGRHGDLINVAGLKVSPEEIEQALDAHPAIVESACVAAADPRGIAAECVKACIVVRADVADEELVQWLRERIEEYKVPRVWQRVERITRTSSGKIQRHLIEGAAE